MTLYGPITLFPGGFFMKRFRFYRFLALFLLCLIYIVSAGADTITRLEYPYGYIALLRHAQGEALSVKYDGQDYFFTSSGVRFDSTMSMEGTAVLSLYSYIFPADLATLAGGRDGFSLGHLHMDGFEEWGAPVCDVRQWCERHPVRHILHPLHFRW